MCDIWRIINPITWNFTFRQSHSNGFIEYRLDNISISDCFQEFVNNTDVWQVLLIGHSPLLISFLSDKSDKNGNGVWKFNNPVVYEEVYAWKNDYNILIIQINLWKTLKQSGNI